MAIVTVLIKFETDLKMYIGVARYLLEAYTLQKSPKYIWTDDIQWDYFYD